MTNSREEMEKFTEQYLPPRFMALILLSCLIAWWTSVGFAVEKPQKSEPKKADKQDLLKNDAPIHIASDRMEVNQKDKVVSFEGHVVVQQADLTITGKVLRVYTLEGPAKQAGEGAESAKADRIDRIEVEGEVKISQQDKIATADKAIYYHEQQKIVLMGKPQFSQGQDTISGRLITLYLPEQRTVVEGAQDTPVHAVLYPEQKER